MLIAGADRYRKAEVTEALAQSKVRWPTTTASWRGTGAGQRADGSADVRAFQRAVLEGKVRMAPSRLMTMAVAESELRFDVAGNPALSKARARSRIDVLSAAVIAIGLASLWRPSEGGGWQFPD